MHFSIVRALTMQIPWLQVLTVGDIVTEVVIIMLPMVGLYKTFMNFADKATVMLAFSTRIPYVSSHASDFTAVTDAAVPQEYRIFPHVSICVFRIRQQRVSSYQNRGNSQLAKRSFIV